jgi:hypothetical protein
VELYAAILKLAPLLLLKLLAVGAFAPWEQDVGRHRRMALAGDVTLVISAVAAGFIAVLVLGDVIAPTDTTRWTVVLAGCLSLLLLATHMLREILWLYRARPQARRLATPAGAASASPGGSK